MRFPAVLTLALAAVLILKGQPRPAKEAPAVQAGGFIYVSGVSGGKGDIKDQTKAALDAFSASLKAAGSSLGNACLVTVYMRHAAEFAAMGSVYAGHFPKDSTGARDCHGGRAARRRRSGGTLRYRNPRRRRAQDSEARGLEQFAAALQLWRPDRRHRVPRRADQPQRREQHQRQGRHHRANQLHHGQRPGDSQASRHDAQ